MKLEVCGVATEMELKSVCDIGADAVGFRVGQKYSGENFILTSTAERLAAKTPAYVVPVLITQESDIDELLSLVARTGIMTLEIEFFNPDNARRLRDRLPKSARIIQRLFVDDDVAMANYEALYPLVSAFVLDFRQKTPEALITLGESGWAKAKDLVQRSTIPVLLSGITDACELSKKLPDLPELYGIEIDLKIYESTGNCNFDMILQYSKLIREQGFSNG